MTIGMVLQVVMCLMLGAIGLRVGVPRREAWTIAVIGLGLIVGITAGVIK